MTSNIIKKLRGFTLIETMVAVLLLTSAIAGPLTIASKGLSAALIARDQMVAFYLAQDGVEYVRYVRDSNRLAGAAWLNGLSACMGASGCTLDDSNAVTPIAACPSSGGCPPLNKQTSAGSTFFTYTGGAQTPQGFARTITLSAPGGGSINNEAVLTVSVSWRAQSGVIRTIAVRENLANWQ